MTSRLPEIRRAIDLARHPALLLVDAVSSLASIDLRHDEWGLDVTLAGSQKGLMLPPGLSFTAISEKALAASKDGPAAPRLLGLGRHARRQCETGSSRRRRRRTCCSGCGRRCACSTRKDCRACSRVIGGSPRRRERPSAPGISRFCASESDEFSPVVTTVVMPGSPGRHNDADRFRAIVLDRFNMSLGAGLGRLKGAHVPHRAPR